MSGAASKCHETCGRDGVPRPLLRGDGALGFNHLTTDAAGHIYVGSIRSGADLLEGRMPSEL